MHETGYILILRVRPLHFYNNYSLIYGHKKVLHWLIHLYLFGSSPKNLAGKARQETSKRPKLCRYIQRTNFLLQPFRRSVGLHLTCAGWLIFRPLVWMTRSVGLYLPHASLSGSVPCRHRIHLNKTDLSHFYSIPSFTFIYFFVCRIFFASISISNPFLANKSMWDKGSWYNFSTVQDANLRWRRRRKRILFQLSHEKMKMLPNKKEEEEESTDDGFCSPLSFGRQNFLFALNRFFPLLLLLLHFYSPFNMCPQRKMKEI